MEEKLAWMDEKYLSHFDAKEVKSEIPYQKPFAETLDIVHEYPVLDGDPLETMRTCPTTWSSAAVWM